MFPQSLRLPLRRKPGFFATAHRSVYPSFIIFSQVVPQITLEKLQIACIAPKKQFPLATKRNAAKRLISQLIVEILHDEKFANTKTNHSVLLVFLLSKRVVQQTKQQLREEITRALWTLLNS